LAALTLFGALANGAHDLWAATAVYWAALAGIAAAAVCAAMRKEPLSLDGLAPSLAAAALLSLSAFHAGNPARALFSLADWLAALSLFWLALQAFRSEKSVGLFVALVAPFFWLELAVILSQRWTSYHSAPVLPARLLYDSVPGTLVNANVAAAFHLLWLPVLVRRAQEERLAAGRGRLFWTVSAACCLLGLLLLNSTSALLCLLLAAPFIAGPEKALNWMRRRSRSARLTLAAGLSLALIVSIHKLLRTDMPLSSKISRLDWWLTGLRMFRANPWLGVGPGNFPSAFLAYKRAGVPNTLFAHSFPIGLLAETGLAGLAGLALFSASWLDRLRRRHQDALGFRWPFLLGTAMLMAYVSINIGLEYLANLSCLALFLGIAAAPAAEALRRPTRLAAALTTTLCLTAAVYAAVPLVSSRLLQAGDDQISTGNASAALKNYEAALRTYPLSSEPRRARARALDAGARKTGAAADLREAAAESERASALDRDNAALRAESEFYRAAAGFD
jgi:O-antigen ligase